MDARIVEFAEVLRQNGIRLSTSEVRDAIAASAEVGLDKADLFRAALRATLIKRELDEDVFARAFASFFLSLSSTFQSLDAGLLEELKSQGLLEGAELAKVMAALSRLRDGLEPILQAVIAGDSARLVQILRNAADQLDLSGLQSPLQSGFYARRLSSVAGMERAKSHLAELEGRMATEGIPDDRIAMISKALSAVLKRVELAARSEVERQLKARARVAGSRLNEKPFQALASHELEQVQTAVRRLAERLKTRLTYKRRAHRRGALNPRRTLRKNLSWGAIPMIPAFRKRRAERPELVVMCDVSDSVRNVSRLMLLFMYTLQTLFNRVRSFVFVSEVGEVTDEFRGAKVEQAIDIATAGRAISLYANSNYGRALQQFAQEQLGSITRRTTLMIIGDGRNNYHLHNARILEELKRKSARLIWICPEDRRNWGFGDSEMLTYSRFCHQVVVVQSLSDLAKVADQLVPSR